VDMKSRRAKHHLDELEAVAKEWIDSKPYTVTHWDDFDAALQVWRVEFGDTNELIPMLVGDYVCCLRSELDQLAWQLAHLDTTRTFTEREERNISFLTFKQKDATYEDRRNLFTSAVADIMDGFQPYQRGTSFGDDPLWQLNELWRMDKHRAIPVNSNSINIRFPFDGWQRYVQHREYGIEVRFPLIEAYKGPVDLEPEVSIEILFGEYMGAFEVSLSRLREINDFVRWKVLPAFAGFFP
jgi:hypothetical protein